MKLPRKGGRFRAKRDVPVSGRIVFGAPFEDSFEGTFPEGEIVIFEGDTGGNGYVYIDPEKHDHFEKVFISEATRQFPDYGDYLMICSYDSLNEDFESLEGDEKPVQPFGN